MRNLALILLFVPYAVFADTAAVEQLRSFGSRGLYDVAETFYRETLAQPNFPEEDKAALGAELARLRAVQAEKKMSGGQFLEAVDGYERAAKLLTDNPQQAENVFRYRRSAVSALARELQKRSLDKNTADKETADTAAVRQRLIRLLRKISTDEPKRTQAEALHLSAIDTAAALPPDSGALLLLALLQEHLRYWNDSPKSAAVRLRTVLLLDQLGRTDEAAAMAEQLDTSRRTTLPAGIQRTYARQLEQGGKRQEAVALLKELTKILPKDTAAVQLLAEMLGRQADKDSLEEALKHWLTLEKRIPKHSAEWKAARTGTIETLFKLGRKDEAEKLQAVTKILYEK